MTKSLVFTLLLSVLAIPAFAAETAASPASAAQPALSVTPTAAPVVTTTSTMPTVTKEMPVSGGTVTTTVTPVTVSGGTGPGGAMVKTETTMTPSVDAVPAAPVTPILGAGATGVADNAAPAAAVAPAPTMSMQAMPVTTTSGAENSNNPLCGIAHTPSADVTAQPAQPVVQTPKMIPLSVDLAGALGIKGFENIVSEGPIGFVTINDQGKVFFEGKDLSTNVANMCASGNIPPVPTDIKEPMTAEKAPDGSSYSSGLPGQTGFRMQPIIDGPSYKYPPKKKKAAPKKEAVTKEEIPEIKAESDPAPVETPSATTDDLGSMMRTAPATTETVPLAPKPAEGEEAGKTVTIPAADAAALPTESETGAAVSEVLGTTPASK